MFGRTFTRRTRIKASEPASVGSALVYAIGDVHGRLDLLNALILKICDDVLESAPTRRPTLIFLGDYIDRGPDSRGVIDRVLALKQDGAFHVRALKGNHEEQMLKFLDDGGAGPSWAQFGGAETLSSYGVRPPQTRTDPAVWEEPRQALAEVLPAAHDDFLRTLELAVVLGDYVFVHAGVRPGVALDRQSERDLLWIREEFLAFDGAHEKVVVHGHTPDAAPHIGHNRIGIDTGAYATGTLTALRLCGAERKVLQTGAQT